MLLFSFWLLCCLAAAAAAGAGGQGLRYICLKWLPSGYPVPHGLHAHDVQLNLHLATATKHKQKTKTKNNKKDESMHCMQTNAKHRVALHVAFGICFCCFIFKLPYDFAVFPCFSFVFGQFLFEGTTMKFYDVDFMFFTILQKLNKVNQL